jgi:hypothetical protein
MESKKFTTAEMSFDEEAARTIVVGISELNSYSIWLNSASKPYWLWQTSMMVFLATFWNLQG